MKIYLFELSMARHQQVGSIDNQIIRLACIPRNSEFLQFSAKPSMLLLKGSFSYKMAWLVLNLFWDFVSLFSNPLKFDPCLKIFWGLNGTILTFSQKNSFLRTSTFYLNFWLEVGSTKLFGRTGLRIGSKLLTLCCSRLDPTSCFKLFPAP